MSEKQRADENRTVTISCPKALVKEIDQLAKKENRPRSNWIVTELRKLLRMKLERREFEALPMAAEDSPEYKGKPKK